MSTANHPFDRVFGKKIWAIIKNLLTSNKLCAKINKYAFKVNHTLIDKPLDRRGGGANQTTQVMADERSRATVFYCSRLWASMYKAGNEKSDLLEGEKR